MIIIDAGTFYRVVKQVAEIKPLKTIEILLADRPKLYINGRFVQELYYRDNTRPVKVGFFKERLDVPLEVVTPFLEDRAFRLAVNSSCGKIAFADGGVHLSEEIAARMRMYRDKLAKNS